MIRGYTLIPATKQQNIAESIGGGRLHIEKRREREGSTLYKKGLLLFISSTSLPPFFASCRCKLMHIYMIFSLLSCWLVIIKLSDNISLSAFRSGYFGVVSHSHSSSSSSSSSHSRTINSLYAPIHIHSMGNFLTSFNVF
jgi:hypothetical protein